MSEDKEQGPERAWRISLQGTLIEWAESPANLYPSEVATEYIRFDLVQRPVVDGKRIAEIRDQVQTLFNKDIEEWLKPQCSRLMNGQCTTRRCLVRGGYRGPSSDYEAAVSAATCEAYEIANLLSCIQPAGDAADDSLTGNERGVLNVLAGTWHRERHEGSDVFNCARWPCHIMTAAIRERCNSVEQKDQVKQ